MILCCKFFTILLLIITRFIDVIKTIDNFISSQLPIILALYYFKPIRILDDMAVTCQKLMYLRLY